MLATFETLLQLGVLTFSFCLPSHSVDPSAQTVHFFNYDASKKPTAKTKTKTCRLFGFFCVFMCVCGRNGHVGWHSRHAVYMSYPVNTKGVFQPKVCPTSPTEDPTRNRRRVHVSHVYLFLKHYLALSGPQPASGHRHVSPRLWHNHKCNAQK
jgi:hypothetical protein